MNKLHIKDYFHLHSTPNISKMVLFTKRWSGWNVLRAGWTRCGQSILVGKLSRKHTSNVDK